MNGLQNHDAPRLLTTGRIAELLDEPLYRVRYAIAAEKLQPVAVAGIAKLYDRSAYQRIKLRLQSNHAHPEPNGLKLIILEDMQ